MSWEGILATVFGLVVVGLGAKYRATKNLIKVVSSALEDDKITKKEIKAILEAAKGLLKGG